MYGKIKYVSVLLLCCSYLSFGQTSEASESEYPQIEIGASLFYYHPNLDELNQGFSQRERESVPPLTAWNNYKISYLVVPTVVYHMNRRNQIALLLGGSYGQSNRQDAQSYYYVWMVGGEYRYMLQSWRKFSATVGVVAGGGIIGAKFHRSYENNVGINVAVSTLYLDGGGTLNVDLTKRLGVKADLKYVFVPTKTLDNLGRDLLLGSVAAGIGLFYTL